MDYGKVDAALAAALADIADADADRRELSVFIHLDDPGDEGREALTRMGVTGAAEHQACTATVSARQVADLSERPWVRQLRLSARLRLY